MSLYISPVSVLVSYVDAVYSIHIQKMFFLVKIVTDRNSFPFKLKEKEVEKRKCIGFKTFFFLISVKYIVGMCSIMMMMC